MNLKEFLNNLWPLLLVVTIMLVGITFITIYVNRLVIKELEHRADIEALSYNIDQISTNSDVQIFQRLGIQNLDDKRPIEL